MLEHCAADRCAIEIAYLREQHVQSDVSVQSICALTGGPGQISWVAF
jgi:hypothetical protein